MASTPSRSHLGAAQTPQGFPDGLLQELTADDPDGSGEMTDEGMLCERAGVPVRTVSGEPTNLKITSRPDLEYARWLVEAGMIEPPILR